MAAGGEEILDGAPLSHQDGEKKGRRGRNRRRQMASFSPREPKKNNNAGDSSNASRNHYENV